MISLDLWCLVEELMPLLREIDRIEALAAKGPNQRDLSDISKPK